jgi:hypothetical protein
MMLKWYVIAKPLKNWLPFRRILVRQGHNRLNHYIIIRRNYVDGHSFSCSLLLHSCKPTTPTTGPKASTKLFFKSKCLLCHPYLSLYRLKHLSPLPFHPTTCIMQHKHMTKTIMNRNSYFWTICSAILYFLRDSS